MLGSHLDARQEKICKEFNDMQIALKFMRTKHDQAVQKLKDLKKEDAALRKQMGIPEEMSYQEELEELQRRAARLFADIEGGGLRAETTRGLGGRQGVADNRAPRANTGTAAAPGPALNQDPRQGSPTEQGTGMTTRNAMARGNRGLGDGSNGPREGNQGRGQENAGPLQDTTAIAGGPVTGRKNNGAPASRERERSRERAPDGQVFLVVFSDDPNERVIGVLFLGAEGDVTAAFFCDCRVCVKSNSGCRCRICVLKERFAREVPNEKDLKGRVLTPGEFEKHMGREKTRKWKETFSIVEEDKAKKTIEEYEAELAWTTKWYGGRRGKECTTPRLNSLEEPSV